jgi:hypothetical protein
MKLLLLLAIVLTFCCMSACVIGPPYHGPDCDKYGPHGYRYPDPYLYRYCERMEQRGGGLEHGDQVNERKDRSRTTLEEPF